MNPWMIVLRSCLLIALAATAALAVDYLRPTGAFCATGSGCDAVRNSPFAALFGWLPVPVLGLIAFPTTLGISLLRPGQLRTRLLSLCLIGGAAMALYFIGLQAFTIGAFCWLCMVTNSATLLAAATLLVAQLASRASAPSSATEPIRPWAWAALGLLAVVGPLLWPQVRPIPPVPEGVRQFYVEGRLNVVEFADFQCPFCRVLHGRLRTLLAKQAVPVNLVRLNAPLDSHEHARDAARAAVCATQQAKGEEMADALFEAEALSPAAIRELTEIVGIDRDLFDRCVASPATDARITGERAILEKIGFEGLPTVFIGKTKLLGLQPESVLGDAIAAALTDESKGGIPGFAYLAIVMASAAGLVLLGRRGAKAS